MFYDGTLKFDTKVDDSGLQAGLGKIGSVAKDALGVLAGNLMTQAANGLASLGSAAMDAGTSLEAGMAKVNTLLRGSDQELAAVKDQIRGISTATGLAADALAESAYSALSASVPAEQLGVMLEKSAKLAAAGFTDVDTALSATAKTMNAYGLTGEDAINRVQKVLMQTQNLGITTVDQLGASLAQVTPTAASFGVSFEQVGAALAVMTAQGTQTAVATTQLRSIIAELGKSGTQAANNLKKAAEGTKYAGMTFTQMMESGATLDEVLGLLAKEAKSTGVSMVDMFSSIEAGQGALGIMTQGGATFRKDLQGMATDADVVSDAYDKVANTLQFKTQQIKISFQNIASSLYDLANGPMLDAADAAIDALAKIQEGLTESGLDGVAEVLLGMFEDAAARVEEFDWSGIAGAIVEKTTSFIEGDGLGRLLTALTRMFTGVVRGISTMLPQLLPVAADAAGYVATALVRQLPAIIDAGLSLADGLVAGIKAALPRVATQAQAVAQQLWTVIRDAAPRVISTAKDIIGDIAKAIPGAVEYATSQVPGIIKKVADALLAKVPDLTRSAGAILQAVISAIPGMAEDLWGMVTETAAGLAEMFEKHGPEIEAAAKEAFEGIVAALSQAAKDLAPTLESVLDVLPGVLSKAIDFVLDRADEMAQAAFTFFGGFAESIPKAVDYAIPILSDALGRIVESVVRAIPGMANAAGKLFDAFTKSIASIDLKLLPEIDEMLGKICDAVANNAGPLAEAATRLFGQITASLGNVVETVRPYAESIVRTVMNVLAESAEPLFTSATGLFSTIAEALGTTMWNLMPETTNLVNSVADALGANAEPVAAAAAGLFGNISSTLGNIAYYAEPSVAELVNSVCAALEGHANEVQTSAASTFSTITNALAQLTTDTASSVTSLIGTIITGFEENTPQVTDAATNLFTSVSDALADAATDLEPKVSEFISTIATELESHSEEIGTAAANLFTSVTGALSNLTGEVAPAAASIATAACTELEAHSEEVMTSATTLFTSILDGLSLVIDEVTPAANSLIDSLCKDLENGYDPMLNSAGSLFNSIAESIDTTIHTLIENLPGNIKSFCDALAKPENGLAIGKAAVQIFMSLVDALTEVSVILLRALPDLFVALGMIVLGGLGQLLLDVWDWIFEFGDLVGNATLDLLSFLGEFFDSLIVLVTAPFQIIGALIHDGLEAIGIWVKDGPAKAIEAAKEIAEGILEKIQELPGKLLDLGGQIVDGLKNGIKNAWEGLKGWFSDKVGGLLGDAKDELEIHSPSRKFETEVGEQIPPGIARGVAKAMPAAAADVRAQAGALVAKMKGSVAAEEFAAGSKAVVSGKTAVAPVVGSVANGPAKVEQKFEQTNIYQAEVVRPDVVARNNAKVMREITGGVH